MFYYRSLLIAFLLGLFGSGIAMAGSIKSGPQVGEKVPGPFKPLNVTGPDAGKAVCQYCKNGSRPVAVIFAPEITPAVTQLLKLIDTATANNKERGLCSFAVVCSDATDMDRQLQKLAQWAKIKDTILTTYKAGGPERYRLAPEAEITLLLYNHLTVKANHVFRKGELNEAAAKIILADLNKMLSDD